LTPCGQTRSAFVPPVEIGERPTRAGEALARTAGPAVYPHRGGTKTSQGAAKSPHIRATLPAVSSFRARTEAAPSAARARVADQRELPSNVRSRPASEIWDSRVRVGAQDRPGQEEQAVTDSTEMIVL
jgi:hypothetical protein